MFHAFVWGLDMMKTKIFLLFALAALAACSDRNRGDVTASRGTVVRTYDLSGSGFQLGVKTSEQLFASFSALTGVAMTQTTVRNTFNTVRPQLPVTSDIASFSPSNQIAIGKLAVEFCDQMIETATLRAAVITSVDFTRNPSVVFASQNSKLAVIQQLKDRFWGKGLDRLPAKADSDETLLALMNDLLSGIAESTTGTRNVVKGICTAVLASAPVTML